MEREHEVRTVIVRYKCDDCGGDVTMNSDVMMTVLPPKYTHKCEKCGKEYTFGIQYPTLRYLPLEGGEFK